MASGDLSSNASCSVCCRVISLTTAGVLRLHGPVASRCSGSRRPPSFHPAPASPPPASRPHCRPEIGSSGQPALLLSEAPLPPKCPVGIIKRIPRASRELAGVKLATILEAVSRDNDHAAWDRLLRFCSRCFRSPPRGGHRRSLAIAINRQLSEETNCSTTPPTSTRSKQTRGPPQDPLKTLASRVSSKLEGDFKGAVKLTCSEDTIADMSIATLSALQQKHPYPHPDSCIPPLPQDSVAHTVSVSVEEVAKAIRLFPNGSAGGPDGLRPQHLKDMVGPSTAGGVHALLSALASFLSLVLVGRTPPSFRPYFFGANLIALQKKNGGVKPIAYSPSPCSQGGLRQGAGRHGGSAGSPPVGVWCQGGGAEAAVHSARLFLHNLKPQQVLLKLDFKNAFNSLRRDKLLATVRVLAPDLLPFVHSSYSLPSFLFWGDMRLQSS